MKRVTTKRSRTARRQSSHSGVYESGTAEIKAFQKITQRCFNNFVRRFGRYPSVHEPLLFDPRVDRPMHASRREMRSQVIAAAKDAGVDARPMLEYLDLVPHRTESSDPRES